MGDMSLWTPYIGGYVIVDPYMGAMSLWDTLCRWLFHCGSHYIDGCAIKGTPDVHIFYYRPFKDKIWMKWYLA